MISLVNGFLSYFVVLLVFVLSIAAAIALGIFLRRRKNKKSEEQPVIPNETGDEDAASDEQGDMNEE